MQKGRECRRSGAPDLFQALVGERAAGDGDGCSAVGEVGRFRSRPGRRRMSLLAPGLAANLP